VVLPLRVGMGVLQYARPDWPDEVEVAATEICPWRRRLIMGEVHDENAWAMGGEAGHAGLFGRAHAVDALACCWLRASRGRLREVPAEVLWRFAEKDPVVPGSTRAIGFDTPSPSGSQAGLRFGPRTIGHLGFTGCSVWLDLDGGLCVTLLSNRVHPSRENRAIMTFRPAFHDLVHEEAGRAGAGG
jgi:serine-type D-Ala-D-Ala carboxypeptidase